jgi:hypothetical protein
MEYRLKRLEKLSGEPVTISSNLEGEIIELDLQKGCKYVVGIDVGDLPPKEARSYLEKTMTTLKEFFGDNQCLLLPRRHGQAQVEVYEIEPVHGEASQQ